MAGGKMELVYKGRRQGAKGTTSNPVVVKQAPKRRSVISRVPRNAIKAKLLVKMGYSEFFFLNTGASGIYSELIFNVNGLYDPDQTFAGHQPYARDAYANMYNKYKVLSFKYTIKAIGNLNSDPAVLTTVLNNSLANVGSSSLAAESDNGKSTLTSFGQVGTLRQQMQLGKLTGRSQAEYSADNLYEAQMGANPPEVMGLHIGISNPRNVVTGALLKVTLEYTVEFFDPLQQLQS